MTESWETPLVRLKDVKKTYLMGKVPVNALRGLDLEINDGEMVAIMGPSGSGKTTLLNVIGLLDSPSTGSYKLVGDEVAKLPDRKRSQLRNKRFGFVFQVYNLLPRLTAAENVMIPLIYGGVPRRERRPRAEAALEAVGLKDRMRHRPSELSGGEQQRVAIARALVNEPSVILADEPTGNLDSKSGAAIMDLIQQLHRQRKVTVLLVTHDPNVATRAERTVQLRDGVVANGEDSESERPSAGPDASPSA
jgi:putative ABC transport system ATP-binding protein